MTTQNTAISTDFGQFGAEFTSNITPANTQIIQTGISQENFLSGLNFQFVLSRTPNTDYYLQAVEVPGLSLPPTNITNPNVNRPIPGDHLVFSQLPLTFKVDEKLKNYFEIFSWMKSISQLDIQGSGWKKGTEGVFSDGSLVILDSKNNHTATVDFTDLWPTNLGALKFNTTGTNPEYITCDAIFSYTDFDITLVTQ
jgi:hypothetical protein